MTSCKKLPFNSKADAKRMLKRTNLNKSLITYKCDICEKWHTTKKRNLARYTEQLKKHQAWINDYNGMETEKW